MTSTATLTRSPALPACPVCHGSGVDDAFSSICNCHLFLRGRSARVAAMPTDVPALTLPPQGDGTGHSTAPAKKANAYAGACLVCGVRVEAGAGLLARKPAGGWGAQHEVCPAAKLDLVDAQVVPSLVRDGVDLRTLPQASDVMYFGVPGSDSRLKVRIDRPTEGRWAGFVFVKDGAEYGAGERYGRQAPGQQYSGEIRDALAAIVADPMGALKRYAELTSRCGICNRRLEDEESVARGIGPVCYGRLG